MSEPFLGEIKLISWNYPPKGWAFCNGQLMPIAQNQALFSLLGTVYGGDGRVTFGLPDLRGRSQLHMGAGFTIGQKGGEEFHTLLASEMPTHNHVLNGDAATAATSNTNTPAAGNSLGQTIGAQSQGSSFAISIYSTAAPNATMAPQTVTNTGGSQPHENRQPFLVLNAIIALQGIFPSRN